MKKILVADDDPAILHSIKMLLTDEGYEVETVVGDKAAEEVQRYAPDLILLDIWMSGINGRDICKLLKSQAESNHIPIIMISAHSDVEKMSKDCGADDFVAKPFDIFKLLDKVERYA